MMMRMVVGMTVVGVVVMVPVSHSLTLADPLLW